MINRRLKCREFRLPLQESGQTCFPVEGPWQQLAFIDRMSDHLADFAAVDYCILQTSEKQGNFQPLVLPRRASKLWLLRPLVL